MENEERKSYFMYFTGKGAQFFGIWAVNIILTIITLGLYYPWAKVAIRKYFWNETSIEDDRFIFHGTGKELFKGFVIAYLMIFALLAFSSFSKFGIIVFYIGIMLLVPYAIFGAWRYRLSRTSWRGIYFSYFGKMSEFLTMYFPELFLTIITFGIYGSWMRVKIMRYLFSHTDFGQYELDFEGEGGDLFSINLLGTILTIFTFYIYLPWYIANRFNFTINNISIHDGEKKVYLKSYLKGGDLFGVFIINALIVVFTLGIGYPWAIMRYFKVLIESIEIPGELNLDNLEQRADDFNDATADDMLDILDLGLDF